ncbi:MAG: type III polyketide synthase, partial [Planctomycetota bacterium]
YSQETLRRLYVGREGDRLRPATLHLLKRVFNSRSGIDERALACAEPTALVEEDRDAVHERYRTNAVALAAEALRDALERAGRGAADLGALVCCTCTGYLCPGLTSYLAGALGLRADLVYFDLVGMGCAGAVPGLRLASATAAENGLTALVAVEVCSATAVFDDDPEMIVSNGIFADGAAAALVDHDVPAALELCDFASVLRPEHRDRLRFTQRRGRMRNRLDRDVPRLAGQAAREVVENLLARNAAGREPIRHWVVHPGGRAVLEEVGRALGLTPDRLADSYAVLRACGNMSSPSVLFVLRSLLGRDGAQPGEHGVCLSFGAGFTAQAALFRVR